MYYVYVLQSDVNGRYYIGVTSDIEQRLRHHNSGANRSTKNGRPWKIIYTEACVDSSCAWKREKQIKSYKGGRAFRVLIQESHNHGEVA